MANKKVAIACQGGGTHAAFSWGVLTTILKTKQLWDASPEEGNTFDIWAISGTSAGALCALATWYGLVPNTADPDCGSIDKAIERLDHLWSTFAATTPVEVVHNQMVGTLLQSKARGVPFPGSNPYDIYGNLGLIGLSMMGARREYLEFPALLEALCPNFETIAWPQVAKTHLGSSSAPSRLSAVISRSSIQTRALQEMGLLPVGKEHDQYSSTQMADAARYLTGGCGGFGELFRTILPAQAIQRYGIPDVRTGKKRNAHRILLGWPLLLMHLAPGARGVDDKSPACGYDVLVSYA